MTSTNDELAQTDQTIGKVFAGVLLAILVAAGIIFAIYSLASANDDQQCAIENAQRVMDGRSELDCG